MPNLKPTEILLLLFVVLLLFGAKRLPDLAKSVGKSMRILKNEVKDLDGSTSSARDDAPEAGSAPSSTPPERTDDTGRTRA